MWKRLGLIIFSIGFAVSTMANTSVQQRIQGLLIAPLDRSVLTADYTDPSYFTRYALAKKIKPQGRRVFIFDPRSLRWAAYDENGRLVKSGEASGGANYCADVKRRCRTPVGTFRLYSKGSANCRSSKYPLPNGGAQMPYCMFFRGGYAIHGSGHVPRHNASHGCIRVKPAAAKWLSQNFMRIGTIVIVRPY